MRRHPLAPWLVLALLALGIALARARAGDEAPANGRDIAAAAPRAADAADAPAASDKLEFVRFSDDGKGGGTLDTAIATYRNADGVTVHLVAAVHVGEKAYYSGLSDTFDTYDALLYELVMPKGGAVPGAKPKPQVGRDGDEGGKAAAGKAAATGGTRIRGAAAIGGLQAALKNMLALESQLESINYDRPNFVHADLDAETFNARQEARGESMFRLMLRSIVNEMDRQRAAGNGEAGGARAKPVTVFDLLAAMSSPDSARQYKLLLARQMQDVEGQIQGIEGKHGSVIISERNKAALEVLERTIGEGKKNLGVFYGAGHMRGIEDALLDEMGFTRTAVEWRVAWDMRKSDNGKNAKPANPAAK